MSLISLQAAFCGFLLLKVPFSAAQQCRLVKPNVLNGVPTPAPTPTVVQTGGTQSGTIAPSATPTLAPFAYGKDPIRSVNLGGWFVLEPWITPSIFQNTNNSAIVDEYTLGQMLDYDVALGILQNHWETWFTEDDFADIQAAGLNHVRMQIGYWSVPLTSSDTNYTTSVSPYIPGAWPYLLQALNWARKYQLRVILDLHGAPGSQNGYDNSGQRTGNPLWGTNTTVPRTFDVINFIVKNIGGMIDMFELINEPAAYVGTINTLLPDFYKQGYQLVRDIAGDDLQVMIHDGFLGVQSWTNFLTYPSAQGVFMDFHEYQIFNTFQIEMNFTQHLQSFADSNIFTVIGEWTTAPTDCAKWLNGRGIGARWDGSWQANQPTYGSCTGFSGNMSTFSDSYKKFLRQYWEAQVQIGEAIQGWGFWTWKAENADDWSYQAGLKGGWIPQDPTEMLYPNMCGQNG